MDETYVFSLLKKFTENKLSDSEHAELQAIFRNADSDPAIHKFMDDIWDTLDTSMPFSQARAEIVYQNIIGDERFLASKKEENPVKRMPVWTKIAASLLLMGVLALGATKIFFSKLAPTAYAHYVAPAGSRLKISLPDGSKVWLNSASSIRFQKDFTARDIKLQGEAFFDVAHDEARPFIVHTGKVSTRVLGTAFNISAYGKETIEVTVTRGKVKVAEAGHQLGLLTPNEQLDYNTVSGAVNEHEVNAGLYTSWTDGELVLNNLSMAEAAKVISRWYNVNFIFKNPDVKNCRFVASFPAKAELAQVMKVISKLNNFKYEIANKNISISGMGCKRK